MDDTSLHLSDPLPASRRFASKVDAWLVAALIVPVVLVGVVVWPNAWRAGWGLALLVSGSLALPLGLVLWMLARTSYVVTPDTLTARCGPFRSTVALASIQSLAASRSARSAPALSLDRIEIRHTGGRLLVSPMNRAGFVRAILKAAPGVTVTGLPGVDPRDEEQSDESARWAGLAPAIVLAIGGLIFGGWQFYAGSRPPEVAVTEQALSISGLYSATVLRQDVVRITLEDRVAIGRRVQGFGGRHLRGYFEVGGMGRSRLFVSRDATPLIVIRTKTQPVILGFEDAARTRALYDELIRTWRLGPPGPGN